MLSGREPRADAGPREQHNDAEDSTMNRNGIKTMTTAAALALGVLSAPSATAATDMFIKIGDIEGESQDLKHKNEIDVLAWSWGMSQSGTLHVGGGGGGGKVCVQDLSFTKWIDKATPDLMIGLTVGESYPDARLTVRSAGDSSGQEPLEYLVINMKNVLVTSVSTGGSGGEDRLTENVTLNFSEVEWTYKTLDGTQPPETAFIVTEKNGCK
jgi:type VI secretion system secreted protein Hcp